MFTSREPNNPLNNRSDVKAEHRYMEYCSLAMHQFNNANVEIVWSYIRLDLENKKDEVKNSEKNSISTLFFIIFTYLLID